LCFDKTASDNIKASSRRHSEEHSSRWQRMDIQSSEQANDFSWFGGHFGSAKVCNEIGDICEERPADYAAQRS
jgi:hypothetical protein